jgi:tetratricopeptide (TPR) repeat protein
MRKPFLIILIFGIALFNSCRADGVIHNQEGNKLVDAGLYAEAVYEYRLAQIESPHSAIPFYNAAIAYSHMGQTDAALAQTLQTMPLANPSIAHKAWYNLGNAYFDAEEWANAISAYKQALRLKPEDMDTKINLELALSKVQDEEISSEPANQQGEMEQIDSIQTQASTSSIDETGDEPISALPTLIPYDFNSMTTDQIVRELSDLLGEQTTLQERIEFSHDAQGPVPQHDW